MDTTISTITCSGFSFSPNPINTSHLSSLQKLCKPKWSCISFSFTDLSFPSPRLLFGNGPHLKTSYSPKVSSQSLSTIPVPSKKYEFLDGSSEVELRLQLGHSGSLITLMETNHLYDKIKPAETIWYIDDDELVINLKKQDPELKWPDIMESWKSLTLGSMQLLKGASNLHWLLAEGSDSVAEAEIAILQSLSSHVRAVVATLGGQQGAARRAGKWRHLYAGFTVWLSQTETTDEDSAKEEARIHIKDGRLAYSNADVVVKLQGWDTDHAKSVAEGCLSALKQLILSDKKLPGKKSLYIRLGCRGDWPNIKPPGWDPLAGDDVSPSGF
ncbi:putative inactive shikimate kinase like 2 chloroplastic [Prunus yedoensis var. nudiflora]|uniref:Putative inactive shikimate kinase like 2 chloroplastic n=1 Tax=Prunus yedoensis var. nudiflora TaxID=2094558 RepID=A0A314Y587_PRUYE|nr:putative inactive shikimate kinase like 2 chloroplastic [Prunus yedoensis var. nudiflora]